MERFPRHDEDGTDDGFAVDDLLSGRSLTHCATLEQAVEVVRTMADCWPGSEDEVVIMPVAASVRG